VRGIGIGLAFHDHRHRGDQPRDASLGNSLLDSVTLPMNLLCTFGTEEQKEKWLMPLATGEKIGAFGLTESQAGSDTSAIQTRAVLGGG